MEPFIGQIIQGGWNFAPKGFSTCDGQLLAISQNTALFSLLGTSFGGNGQTTFGLPDLRGRSMVHWGTGPGLSPMSIGQSGGNETTTLSSANLPPITLHVSSTKSTLQLAPAGGVIGRSVDLDTAVNANPAIYCPAGTTTDVTIAGIAGGGVSAPFGNRSPFQAVTHVIALQGIFPSRN
ncbi:MAG: tail fiber protein [Sphingomonadales bacterium]|nr:tail fiber protein [Sphingomonadales bacterium]MBD3772418.1 tail fiber protein [Paracoccaceae bacterium]